MNIFTKSALAVLATSCMASVAMAAPGDASYGTKVKVKADIQQLTSEIQQLGAQPASGVNVNTAHSVSARGKLLQAKEQSLKLQLNELKGQSS